MKTVSQIHNYWKNPDDKNRPEDYLIGEERTAFLLDNVLNLEIPIDAQIIEIGCNVGRNLNGFFNAGFKNLTGIEINRKAIDVMSREYSVMYRKIKNNIHNKPVEQAIYMLEKDKYDVVYTMAVLEHIHEENGYFVFSEMFRIAKKYIVVIEDERKESDRHFRRNYKDVFEFYGLKEIKSQNCKGVKGLGKSYNLRIFEK